MATNCDAGRPRDAAGAEAGLTGTVYVFHATPEQPCEDEHTRLSADLQRPPDYETATKLPTYEEAERSKAAEAAAALQAPRATAAEEELQLGTDAMFFAAFLVCFLFNWIGLLAVACFTETIAARYGAISGFGLSLVKWLCIMRNSQWTHGLVTDAWLWWILVAMGFVICLRGTTEYIRLRYHWKKHGPLRRDRMYWY